MFRLILDLTTCLTIPLARVVVVVALSQTPTQRLSQVPR